jgi:3'(2'), 5'-bisphosphate nucleotidase
MSGPLIDIDASLGDPSLDDVALASHIASATSQALLDLQAERGIRPDDPEHTRDLKDAGDALAHTLITTTLASARPQDAVMSEEGDWGDEARLSSRRVWIVDPLDATKEFGLGIADWAVQIALLEDGALTAAAMDLGARDVRWSTSSPRTTDPVSHSDGTLIAVVSRSRPPEGLHDNLAATVEALDNGTRGFDVRMVGGVGGKVDELLSGRAHLYVGPSWCYEWDAAAPLAVAAHLGYSVCDFEGQPLRYNKPHPAMEGLLVGSADVIAAWLRVTNA